jgi:hypothetical protein
MQPHWTRFPCPTCGKIVQQNWSKCLYCGSDLSAEKEKRASIAQPVPSAEPPAAPAEELLAAATAQIPSPEKPADEPAPLAAQPAPPAAPVSNSPVVQAPPAAQPAAQPVPRAAQTPLVSQPAAQVAAASKPPVAPTPLAPKPSSASKPAVRPAEAKPAATSRPSPSSPSPKQTKAKAMPVWGWILIGVMGVGCLGMTIITGLFLTGTLAPKFNNEPAAVQPTTQNVFFVPTATPAYQEPAATNPPTMIPFAPTQSDISQPTQVPAATIVPQQAQPLTLQATWFSPDKNSPTLVYYAFIIANPNQALAIKNARLQAVAYDASGVILATTDNYLSVILPGVQVGMPGMSPFNIPQNTTVAKVDVKVTDMGQPVPFEVFGSPFTFDKISYFDDPDWPVATGILRNPQNADFNDVSVSAIAYDAAGNIVGAGNGDQSNYLPAGGDVPVAVRMKVNGAIDKIVMYSMFTNDSNAVAQPEKNLPGVTATGATQDDNGNVNFVFLVDNPNTGKLLQYLTYRAAIFDDSGRVLAITTGQINSIFPGERQAQTGSTHLPAKTKASIVQIQVVPPHDDYDNLGIVAAGLTTNPLKADQVAFFPGDYEARVTGIVINSSDKEVQARVVAVAYDANGNLIAGAETYLNSVPGNAKVAVEIHFYPKVTAAKVEIYPSISGLKR